MKDNSLTIKGRVDSFKFAFRGIATLIRSQQNAWIHALATVAVVVLGVVCSLTRFEWCWIVLAAASVWTAEAFNTALEFLTDLASPEIHPLAAKTKDVAAGAVLIAAIGAALIGCLIFIPHLLSF
ncbi:MAG: diacylglycerol kinase family protein [Acidobacteriota bacterium]|nr:diacylglycerol kinase family protein [Acidobacteriota bacterium]